MSRDQQQSRAEKREQLYRKPGRPGNSYYQRVSSSGAGKGGGGTSLPPAFSNSQSSSQSYKKPNRQDGESRVTAASVKSELSAVRNDPHAPPSLSDASVKPTDVYSQKSIQTPPRAPSSQSSSGTSDSTAPTTPVKGEISRGVSLQFGSFSPDFVNGMQIPARTSSAPPNLDEQKHDQASHDSFKSVSILPTSSISSQQHPREGAEQSKKRVPHLPLQSKRDVHVQVLTAPVVTSTQNSSTLPVSGGSMNIPCQQSQIPIQFGQAQGATATSLQMPIPLQVGSSSQVYQPIFVPGLQPRSLQPQGLMHHGQRLNFPPQISHQLGSQLDNFVIGIVPQFPQQQPGKFGPHTSVKITHPETHEELRLDKRADIYMDGGSSGLGSHPNVPLQSQPIPYVPSHQINYFSRMQPNPIFFQSPTSVHPTSSQMPPSSQAVEFNYAGGQDSQMLAFKSSLSINPVFVATADPGMRGTAVSSNMEQVLQAEAVISATSLLTITSTAGFNGGKVLPSSVSGSSTVHDLNEVSKLLRLPVEVSSLDTQGVSKIHPETSVKQSKSVPESACAVPSTRTTARFVTAPAACSVERFPPGDAASMPITSASRRTESVRRLDSIKDQLKKPRKKYQQRSQPQQQVETSESADSSTTKALREEAKCPGNMQSPRLKVVEPSTSISTRPLLGVVHMSSEDVFSETVEGVFDASIEGNDGVRVGDVPILDTSNKLNVNSVFDILNGVKDAKQVAFPPSDIQLREISIGSAEQGKIELSEQPKVEQNCEDDKIYISGHSLSFESDLNIIEPAFCNELDTTERELNVPEGVAGNSSLETYKKGQNLASSASPSSDSNNSDVGLHILGSLKDRSEDKTVSLEALQSRSGCMDDAQELSFLESGETHQDTAPIPIPLASAVASKLEGKVSKKANGDSVHVPSRGLKDRPILELNRVKKATSKGKMIKEILQKADAAGTTSDLYIAYKGPEEKPRPSISSESVDSNSSISERQISSDFIEEDVAAREDGKNKAELDDWEDAADIATPKLEISDDVEKVHGSLRRDEEGGTGIEVKKWYSRDFLLTLSGRCTNLPAGLEIASDIMEALVGSKANISKGVDRNYFPSSGRIIDRPVGLSRVDYRASEMVGNDKGIKSPGYFASRPDPHFLVGQGGNALGFWPGHGGYHSFFQNLHRQTPAQFVGGFPPGPFLPLATQGGIQYNGPDADRWQRATGFQKGLIPSPKSIMQVMHKAETKYEVGKVADVEQAKQRQLKAILNKLTPQNFDRLFEQVKEVNIDNAVTLTGAISQIFDKALMEPTFCEMYANFCYHLASELPDFVEDNEKITFKRVLLNKCQEEFERGEREQAEADRVEGDGEVKQSKAEREEKRIQARRRMLGNIRLIGELYKKKMLTERIMHDCIKKLLGQYQNPDEEDIEALCKLMSTIGEMIDHSIAKGQMDAYFDTMTDLSNNMKLSSRVRFMLKDAIDLRKNKWQQRRKVEGPKKIEELHRDAAQERQAQISRLARGPSFSSSARWGQPVECGPRASTMLSPTNTQMSAFRGAPSQIRGFGTRGIQLEERHPFENRTLSVPLLHRPIDDNTITLGPQGGLGRGMSVRGQQTLAGAPLADIYTGPGESRRMPAGPNGYSSVSDRTTYNSRQEPMSRYVQERLRLPAFDQSNRQGHSMRYGFRDLINADRSFDRSMASSPSINGQRSSAIIPNVSSGKIWPEERLREMSMAAIREFYSARDENEVALCIRDLNSPSFYPSMISIWVNDSFERKDMHRDLLSGLLVNLAKSRDGILNSGQLIEGFESVLATLEDAATDAPKAAEFLGHIFARIIIENILSLREIGRLIRQGGEEPGHLLQSGLGYEVLESAFEIIRLEKGESVLNEICRSSNIQLEDFRYSRPAK